MRTKAPRRRLALDEVIVTATRRAVSAQDLPISITAVTGATPNQSGVEDVAELAHSMAGASTVTTKGPFSGCQRLRTDHPRPEQRADPGQLRSCHAGRAAVATYVDDTPLFFRSCGWQDLDRGRSAACASAAERMYGSGSLGGTIRYVQNAPDPTGFDAKAEAGVKRHATHARAERRNQRRCSICR